ncbi:hypothetical protein P0W64_00005 [Tsukamurella sp. 8F]|uniref:hypothetical protein n=1 Tax=unclassified Tsukamurella TaxID=2633480 RepID=UPI0023B988D0|nr:MULTISPECIES: hypothetical protein [unclassified Tsukamurella]MDF0532638.1 hypothetical protein [Tsukamurella sp. 8J]MDF0585155.1 hypothetical protein [Tsukamurella sp. 8F]
MHSVSTGAVPVVVVPGAPLLVPELVGAPGDPDADDLRAAAVAAARRLGARAARWRVVTTGEGGPVPSVPDGVGTLRGFGADVDVTLAPGERGPADPTWPAWALVAGWLRGVAAPHATVTAGPPEPGDGLLFVLDGPNTLTAKAPGGHRPEDTGVFARQVDAVCSGGPVAGLTPAWAAAATACRDRDVEVLYRGAPFGVGYLVATA